MKIGIRNLGITGGVGNGSLAIFTVYPEIVEYTPPSTSSLTVTPGNETLSIAGISGIPTSVTPGQEVLSMELLFP